MLEYYTCRFIEQLVKRASEINKQMETAKKLEYLKKFNLSAALIDWLIKAA
jgi:hypothetical protein